MRDWIFLECGTCGNRYYRTSKQARAQTKLLIKKFCNKCRAHTEHKERKK